MFAVIKTGGKQFRVAADEMLAVSKLAGEAGDQVTFSDVLVLGGDAPKYGAPLVDGASVVAEIVEQKRGPKIIVFKKRRRQNYRRTKGHRQQLTLLKVTDILTGGAKPKAKAAAKKAEAKKETAADIKDDVSLIGGVGPKLKEKLAEYGVTSLKQIAEMSAGDLAKMDEKLELHGRAERDEWVAQAKELLAGKPPRAKTDKARSEGKE